MLKVDIEEKYMLKVDNAETLLIDGNWLIRRSTSSADVWASHTGCYETPRRVRDGKCHACAARAPQSMMGFLDMVYWEI